MLSFRQDQTKLVASRLCTSQVPWCSVLQALQLSGVVEELCPIINHSWALEIRSWLVGHKGATRASQVYKPTDGSHTNHCQRHRRTLPVAGAEICFAGGAHGAIPGRPFPLEATER